MRKVVTTEMTEKFVLVTLDCPELNNCERALCKWSFPLDLVNPRIALQIATLLTSDPTVPPVSTKCEGDCESKEE